MANYPVDPGNKEFSITHHVVYSVKGGCGKTSFSLYLLLSQFLDQRADQLKDENAIDVDKIEFSPDSPIGQKNVKYFFDMDFLGTSIESIIKRGETENYIKTNDLIFNVADIEDATKEPNKISGGIYIVPSSSAEKDKERFHVKRRHTPLLRYDEFRYEIEAVVDRITRMEKSKIPEDKIDAKNYFEHEKDSDKIDKKAKFRFEKNLNIIYDLPPNSDGYTEALFDYLIKKSNEKDADKRERVVLYLVFNNDPMMDCNLDWLKNFTSSVRDVNFTFCLVRNDTDKSNPYREEADLTANGASKEGSTAFKLHTARQAAQKLKTDGTTKEKEYCYLYNPYVDEVKKFNNRGLPLNDLYKYYKSRKPVPEPGVGEDDGKGENRD
ncbi:MAG: hypothetical protein LUD72_05485 [Bacteroidales bacterium]|nr:hypothetical protein [Bacteroidales bacterium]